MVTKRRTWTIVGASGLAGVLLFAGAAYFAFVESIDRIRYTRHAPGTYYFVSFTGPWVPWRPVDEIPRDEALSRDSYVVGIYNDIGQLAVIERYLGGSLFFRHEYSYDGEGKLREKRSWQAGRPVRTQRFDAPG
jgi:hypothetical protein